MLDVKDLSDKLFQIQVWGDEYIDKLEREPLKYLTKNSNWMIMGLKHSFNNQINSWVFDCHDGCAIRVYPFDKLNIQI